MIGCSIASPSAADSVSLTQVPSLLLNEDRTWIGIWYRRAYSTHRSISTFAPRSRHDPRVSGEDAVHIGVDLAEIRAERRGQCHGGGVRRAAAKRGDVLRGLGHALEPGHDRDGTITQRCLDPAGSHVDDAGLAMRRVGDDPGL